MPQHSDPDCLEGKQTGFSTGITSQRPTTIWASPIHSNRNLSQPDTDGGWLVGAVSHSAKDCRLGSSVSVSHGRRSNLQQVRWSRLGPARLATAEAGLLYTAAALKSQTVKDLGKLASELGVQGWRSMRKDELVRALVHTAKSRATKSSSGSAKRAVTTTATKKSKPKPKPKPKTKPEAKPKNTQLVRRIQQANEARSRRKNLATPAADRNGHKKAERQQPPKKQPSIPKTAHGRLDRVVLLVRDAYWLQAVWELSRQSVERAQAAMAEQWHTAKPALRLIQLDSRGTTSTSERVVREIEIHGGVKTWYIDVQDSPQSYRVDIGYLSSNGRFFGISRSNSVSTPRPGNGDENWSDIAENCEKIYALSGGYTEDSGTRDLQEMFEERLGRRMGSPSAARYGVGADKLIHRARDFQFEVEAEMIIYGATKPNSHVTLAGTPIKLRADGSFSARLSMPDRRQVLPIVASSPDGVEQRTVVLAIERNTKVMEPRIHEGTS